MSGFFFPSFDLILCGVQTDPHKQDLLRGHDSEVVSVAFSPSGRMLVSGQRKSMHRDGEQIIVWEYESRKPIYRLTGVRNVMSLSAPLTPTLLRSLCLSLPLLPALSPIRQT